MATEHAREHGTPEAEVPFEQHMERLEAIVRTLEKGDVPLEESLALFEEGVRIARICSQRLDAVEGKIEVLLGIENEAPVTAPFQSEEITKED